MARHESNQHNVSHRQAESRAQRDNTIIYILEKLGKQYSRAALDAMSDDALNKICNSIKPDISGIISPEAREQRNDIRRSFLGRRGGSR